MNKIFIVSFVFFLFLQTTSAQNQGEKQSPKVQTNKSTVNVPEQKDSILRATVKIQAEEIGSALITGEYGKIYDFTHPKAHAFIGSRSKFVADLQRQIKADEAEGFKLIKFEATEPSEIVRIKNQMFAVVPTKLRMQTPQGLYEQESFDIAVSDDGGKTWKFIGGSISKEKLKMVFPEAVEGLQIPEEKLPYPYKESKD